MIAYGSTVGEEDRVAFVDHVRRHDERLRALAYKMLLGDWARMEDVLQDAYLRAFRSYEGFRSESDAGTWLHRVVYNACLDELRRGRRRDELTGAAQLVFSRRGGPPGPERTAEARDTVLRALATLPADQRATVLLVDGEGFDNVTAASVLGVAPGTVASRLSRARAALRAVLAEEDQ